MTTTANFEDIVTGQESADTWQISGRVSDRSYATIATAPFLSRAIGDRWLRIPSARLSNDRHRTARRWSSLINRFFWFCISCTLIERPRMLVRLWNVYMWNRRKVKYFICQNIWRLGSVSCVSKEYKFEIEHGLGLLWHRLWTQFNLISAIAIIWILSSDNVYVTCTDFLSRTIYILV